ncbi:hypothetical protein CYLTODRAFT_212208 [Cylindrobasidium torrendii FP15055 ss-10]|uniref:Uncharacterized protein n=1 Tax=Cylindrobasidium torrendii FP15055 ss-10 TaxID=1314674 RepID=A0A0D7BI69_9AGAR|nr:hypothetical protein CYLTODRAFT_212208 [Cylindrobasidium torrendii FP15055 ss-10]
MSSALSTTRLRPYPPHSHPSLFVSDAASLLYIHHPPSQPLAYIPCLLSLPPSISIYMTWLGLVVYIHAKDLRVFRSQNPEHSARPSQGRPCWPE